jgi:hypothetical protein
LATTTHHGKLRAVLALILLAALAPTATPFPADPAPVAASPPEPAASGAPAPQVVEAEEAPMLDRPREKRLAPYAAKPRWNGEWGMPIGAVVLGAGLTSLTLGTIFATRTESEDHLFSRDIAHAFLISGGILTVGGVATEVVAFRYSEQAMNYELASGYKYSADPKSVWLIGTLGGLVLGGGLGGLVTGSIAGGIYQARFNKRIRPTREYGSLRPRMALTPSLGGRYRGMMLSGSF